MQETINIRRGADVTPITYIDSGQIAEIKKHGNRFHEFTMLEAIAKMNLPIGTFIDVGAHVGNHSIFFVKYVESCSILHSFEASPITFDMLERNFGMLTGNITRFHNHNAAVGAKASLCDVIHNEERPGQSKVIDGSTRPMFCLDDMMWEQRPVLIKIDVEGTEYDILEGAKQTISKYRPELFVETFGEPEKLLNHLPKGYRIVKRYNNAPTYHLSWQI